MYLDSDGIPIQDIGSNAVYFDKEILDRFWNHFIVKKVQEILLMQDCDSLLECVFLKQAMC